MESQEICAVCSGNTKFLFSFQVRGEHLASLQECLTCRFTFIANPHWLAESFSSELNDLDIGSVDRCLILADFVEVLIRFQKWSKLRFLDWGGGYGLLARIMRDRGLDFGSHDMYTRPLFVEQSEISESDTFELVTMSEVALHLTDPVPVFKKILESTNTLVFTAVIAPNKIPNDWWYLMPDTGQHVGIYHQETLEALANQLGVRITSDGRFFHVLHRERLGIKSHLVIKFRPLVFAFAWFHATARLVKRGLGKNISLTPADQADLIAGLPWNRKSK
jgi:hypothetical protein